MKNRHPVYKQGFRDGVMAERRRAVRVAASAMNGYPDNRVSLAGQLIAAKISTAGDRLPPSVEEAPIEEWDVGETGSLNKLRRNLIEGVIRDSMQQSRLLTANDAEKLIQKLQRQVEQKDREIARVKQRLYRSIA